VKKFLLYLLFLLRKGPIASTYRMTIHILGGSYIQPRPGVFLCGTPYPVMFTAAVTYDEVHVDNLSVLSGWCPGCLEVARRYHAAQHGRSYVV
jgi:hypothetical protein